MRHKKSDIPNRTLIRTRRFNIRVWFPIWGIYIMNWSVDADFCFRESAIWYHDLEIPWLTYQILSCAAVITVPLLIIFWK